MHDFLGKTWRFTNHVESKNNRELPLWYVLFHVIITTTTLDQWTRSFFPPLGIMKNNKKKKEKLL